MENKRMICDIKHRLKEYDNSHPKMDELKFIQDIMDDYDIERDEALKLIRVARISKCCCN